MDTSGALPFFHKINTCLLYAKETLTFVLEQSKYSPKNKNLYFIPIKSWFFLEHCFSQILSAKVYKKVKSFRHCLRKRTSKIRCHIEADQKHSILISSLSTKTVHQVGKVNRSRLRTVYGVPLFAYTLKLFLNELETFL